MVQRARGSVLEALNAKVLTQSIAGSIRIKLGVDFLTPAERELFTREKSVRRKLYQSGHAAWLLSFW